VITHAHEDHIGGADAVIRGFDIGTVYMPKVTSNTKTFKYVVSAIYSKGLKACLLLDKRVAEVLFDYYDSISKQVKEKLPRALNLLYVMPTSNFVKGKHSKWRPNC